MKVKMKEMFRMTLMALVTGLLVTAVPVLAAASEADDSIESSAMNSYVFKNILHDDDVTVKSMDGLVTLTGTVAQEAHKPLAEETVANLPGVKSVDNRLEVKDEPAAKNSDAWVTMKVKTALLFHRNVSAMTEVATKDGIVTLQGSASSQAQKDLTTELVKDVEGVKEVQNEMALADASMKSKEQTMGQQMRRIGGSIDDASVTALVKVTLLYHRSTSALDTKVVTTNGQVTLEGKAENAAEKDLATKYVQDVYGVNSVVNNMTVEKPKAKKTLEGC